MSTTWDGISYSGPTFSGDVDFKMQPGSTLKVDPYGLDSVTRIYAGGVHKIAEELLNWKRDRSKRDIVYTHCFLADYTVTDDGTSGVLTATFKGTSDGSNATETEPSWGVRAASVTLRYTDDDPTTETDETITLKYYAPYTTWKYATEAEPQAARYPGQLKLVKEAWQINGITGDSTKSRNFIRGGSFQGGTTGGAVRVEGAFNGVRESVMTQFDVVRSGKWHLVTETNEGQILPWDLGDKIKRIIA